MRYDAYLSYNTNDRAAVEAIALYLKDKAGMKVFFDLWGIVPGTPVQEVLEKALVCVIFVGPSGLGTYQNEEARIALEKSISKKDIRVIPVLLPGGKRKTKESELPPFLRQLSWVEFGDDFLDPEALWRLECGIKNINPGPGVKTMELHPLGESQNPTALPADIKIIEQIEKQIGKKLKSLPLEKISGADNGYALDNAGQVQGLNLEDTKIKDISFLRDLCELTHLSLGNNQLTNLTPLSALKKLTMLDLSGNQITDLKPLSSLTKLTTLILERNQITDIRPLHTLTNLKDLELRNNNIEDITPLAALTHLERLILIRNRISDISPLSGLIGIKTLSLSNNKIIRLSPLSPLTSLTKLWLNKNNIDDLTPLSALTQLVTLGLRLNKINDITPLKELPNLKGLNVSKNNINKLPTDIDRWRSSMEIIWVDDDTAEKDLNLFDNPLTDPPEEIVKKGKAAVKNHFNITPTFEIDIFISYCHDDNVAPSNENGWVDHFHEALESHLARRFGHKKVSIWRDKKLQGSTFFDIRIQEQIRKSALFFALLASNYLNSEYCLKELEWFHQEAEKIRCGLSINGESRIFNVLLRNIHHSQWPKQLQGTSGFPMHDQKKDSGNLGDFLDYHDEQYNKKLRSIVEAVEKILNFFRSVETADIRGDLSPGKKSFHNV